MKTKHARAIRLGILFARYNATHWPPLAAPQNTLTQRSYNRAMRHLFWSRVADASTPLPDPAFTASALGLHPVASE